MSVWCALSRRKHLDESDLCHTDLARVLTTYDLTSLGVGSTLGVGIYVLAGEVSKTVAGPAVVISFLFAAITSAFAGLCYAEFGARIPRAGSAYIYSYYCVGELIAFIIGWTLILEYVIGAASVARGISTYIDCLLSNKIRTFLLSFASIDCPFLSAYVDFFAFGLCIILSLALIFGVKESSIVNNFFTFCNLSVVAFIIISGLFKADGRNWHLQKKDIPPEAGEGGFAPFGFVGIMRGAAICFYGFVGFDCIATTGEEVRNPQRAIPRAILLSLLIIFLAYLGVSTVLTLMWPYYYHDPDAPLPYMYECFGWDAARWLVSVGALFGLFSSLFGAMFPLPRVIYAMASDGVIFRILGCVNLRTRTPALGTAFAGLVTATMAALFNLQQLISLMALGALLAYTIVAMSVLILRYSPDSGDDFSESPGESTYLFPDNPMCGLRGIFVHYFNCGSDVPTPMSRRVVVFNIMLYAKFCVMVAVILIRMRECCCGPCSTVPIVVLCVTSGLMFMVVLSMCSQPKSSKCQSFQMPCVPLLPCLSIFCNIYLMVVLDCGTWIKFSIWMAVGFVVYFSYGIRHSSENPSNKRSVGSRGKSDGPRRSFD